MKYLLVLLTLFFVACDDMPRTSPNDVPKYKVIRIEGCQYITVEHGTFGTTSYNYAITHMGNCDSPIHPRPKGTEDYDKTGMTSPEVNRPEDLISTVSEPRWLPSDNRPGMYFLTVIFVAVFIAWGMIRYLDGPKKP